MYEDAQESFDYLPIRRGTLENDYIDHLWQAFSVLGQTDTSAQPFAVMPFHLLFMLSVQYKVLRIASLHKQATNLFFTGVGGRNKEQLLSEQRSVFDMALINERTIPDIFQLIEVDSESIKKNKELVDERNDNLAHAKVGMEQNLENKLDAYISVLDSIQKRCGQMNHNLAEEWIAEIKPGDDLNEFIEAYLFDSRVSPRDFGDIVGKLLEAEQLDFEQWEQVVNKGLELAYDQTILALQRIAENDIDDGKKFNATRILEENGVDIGLSLEEAQDLGII